MAKDVIRVTEACMRVMGHAAYGAARQSELSILDTIDYFDIDNDISNHLILSRPEIGGIQAVSQTALSLPQAVLLLMGQQMKVHNFLLDNVVSPRNRGFIIGQDGKLYEVLMDVWHPRVAEEEFILDVSTLDESIWKAGSRIFYNKDLRISSLDEISLSMSVAREIYTGIRSGHYDPLRGEFPLVNV